MSKSKGRGWKNEGEKPKNKDTFVGIPRRYEEACAQIRQSLDRFVFEDESENDEEEEPVENEAILTNVLRSYNGGGDSCLVDRTEQCLKETLSSGGNVCLICIETVKRADAIWSCKSCYCILHLPCIQKWSKDSIDFQTVALENNSILQQRIKWCCPKCRKEHGTDDRPQQYRCFCGKVVDPPSDPWVMPHSCGETCGRLLGTICSHACLLLCHPGPCPPCPKTVECSCHCGRSGRKSRRCGDREWSCGQKCGHKLTCGLHACEATCHKGECEPCPKKSLQKCLCGKREVLRECASPTWNCDVVCCLPLSCGQHVCERICHKGSCGDCPRTKPRSCPCGKTRKKLPCTEDLTTCGDTCEKLLECELHRCSQRCHYGPCGNCLQLRGKQCRCGAKRKSVPCSKEYICDSKCKGMRDCGRHACSRKCCEGQCPPCEQNCGRSLNCKNHKCSSLCHQGPCYPCPLTATIQCNCGETKITVPCGREKTMKPPKCSLKCKIPPVCHHPHRLPHRCHFGRCPPCRQECSLQLTGCKHCCPSTCHDAVLTQVSTGPRRRAGPWEPIPTTKEEIVCQPCPPCIVPMPMICLGLHETSMFACSEVRPWSCHRPCGRQLACTNHKCQLPCHAVENAPSFTQAGENCAPCEEACSKPRPSGCSHACGRECHPDPCGACTRRLRTSCHCALSTLYPTCSEVCDTNEERKVDLLCCQNRCPKQMSCGHRCPLVCHPGRCPSQEVCKKKVTLHCPCKRRKQEVVCNRRDGTGLECDTVCAELRMTRDEEGKDKKQCGEELERQRQELEEYKRKFEGGKRRKHKSKQKELLDEGKCRWFRWKVEGIVVAGVALIAAVCFLFLLPTSSG